MKSWPQRGGPNRKVGELIKDLIDVQLNLLKAKLAEEDPDPEVIVEQAEAIFLYAQILRDFPQLPELLRTQYPEPPLSFVGAFDAHSTVAPK